MTPLVQNLIVAFFTVVLTAMIAFCLRLSVAAKKRDEEIAVLKTQISPLWARVQKRISDDLHQPHARYLEMDGLLEKLEGLTITPNDRERLKVLLAERSIDMHPDITPVQRGEAMLMRHVMDLVQMERAE
jgi:hypothetical protein